MPDRAKLAVVFLQTIEDGLTVFSCITSLRVKELYKREKNGERPYLGHWAAIKYQPGSASSQDGFQ